MKKYNKAGSGLIITGLIIIISSIIAAIVIWFSINNAISDAPESIGIIGGADAPTAEFLAEKAFRVPIIAEFVSIAAGTVMTIIGIILITKKKKGDLINAKKKRNSQKESCSEA